MLNAINRQTAILPGDITGQVKPQTLEQAAGQFEALMLRSMLSQMRKASDVLGEDNPFNSKQQRMMRDFYDDKMASELASQRSTGIAQMIINQLSPQVTAPLKNQVEAAALQGQPQERHLQSFQITEGQE
ncbi:rod-binding protein [Enterobacter cloacae complex sp. P40RS]|uniref:Rod-binding protein n=2 Tax=Enterobacter cloacae complex TaxID=354276 RepID=A0A7H8UAU4_ENTCL|nr:MULTISPECIES: rod-binding protein [Enterobacter cloacae complex]MBE4854316.1 rod-binding protein [Enterobacter pasteurii]MBE4864052.1 rod-binding protein [Enterobacter cloacae complex sp. P40C2]MBE4876234.1 rod-binding protein [Enterobacter cloacae complex sp. P40C]MCY0773323.1 rod-binding protein [Enterobacter cloacae complex sp. 2022EL-00788]MDE4081002.1 rod-binding protein [Enterobacter pasteurii]